MSIIGLFAAGNFLNDILNQRPIEISSDGSSIRSYFYMSDLTIWLWTIFIDGCKDEIYNIGLNLPISIKTLADEYLRIARQLNIQNVSVRYMNRPSVNSVYFPCINKAQSQLNLKQTVPLNVAIEKTLRWYLSQLTAFETTLANPK